MHDRSFNLKARQDIAEMLLREPETPSHVIAEKINMRAGVVSSYIVNAGGLLPFFTLYGGEWATKERMEKAAQSYLARATEPTRRRLSHMSLPQKAATLKSFPACKETMLPTKSLSERECHWILNLRAVNSGDELPQYCCKEVHGPYCEEHTAVAAEEYKKRCAEPVPRERSR